MEIINGSPASRGPAGSSTGSITAQNTGITGIFVKGQFSIDISGTWVATVFLQRSYDGSNWRDVESYTANCELTYEDKVGSTYRLFVKTGGYTSGTVVAAIRT